MFRIIAVQHEDYDFREEIWVENIPSVRELFEFCMYHYLDYIKIFDCDTQKEFDKTLLEFKKDGYQNCNLLNNVLAFFGVKCYYTEFITKGEESITSYLEKSKKYMSEASLAYFKDLVSDKEGL